MTGKKAALVFTLCVLVCLLLPGAVTAILDKPAPVVGEPVVYMAAVEELAAMAPAEAVETAEESEAYPEWLPLTPELWDVTVEVCEADGVPVSLALAVMEQESGFDPEALNPGSGCYGLMQLNPTWFPSGLTPAENIRAGIGYLGELLEAYGGEEQAVTAYFYGPSRRASSWYSDEVLEKAEAWKEVLSE